MMQRKGLCPLQCTIALLLKVNNMQIEQIITALQTAKLYEAAKLQCENVNIDNLSMLVAIATGKVATIKELFAVYTYTWK